MSDEVSQDEGRQLYPVGVGSYGTRMSKTLTVSVLCLWPECRGMEEWEGWKGRDGRVSLAVVITRAGEGRTGAEGLETHLGCSVHRS